MPVNPKAKEAITATLGEFERLRASTAQRLEEAIAAGDEARARLEQEIAAINANIIATESRMLGLGEALAAIDPPPQPDPPPVVVPPVTGQKLNLHGFTAAANEQPAFLVSQTRLDTQLKGGVKSTVAVTFPGSRDRPWFNRQNKIYEAIKAYGMRASVSVPLVFVDDPDEPKWQGFIEAAKGNRDAMHRQFAKMLVDSGCGDAIIRLAWEWNLRGSFPYGAQYDWRGRGAKDNGVNFKAAWRRIASVYLSVSDKFVLDFCMFKDGHLYEIVNGQRAKVLINPDEWFPDDVKGGPERLVKCAGVDVYDGDHNYSPGTSDVLFRRMAAPGIPIGPEAWWQWCQKMGVPFFSLPEMGIRVDEENPQASHDNPGYWPAMLQWMATKNNILYWSHFARADSVMVPQTKVGTTRATEAFKSAFKVWKQAVKA